MCVVLKWFHIYVRCYITYYTHIVLGDVVRTDAFSCVTFGKRLRATREGIFVDMYQKRPDALYIYISAAAPELGRECTV